MTGQRNLPWGGATELADDILVYRAALRERWLKGGVRTIAFIRRPSDHDGLPINNPDACSPQQLCATFIECYGVMTLQVGRIRSLGLDVKPDTEPDPEVSCDHGNIVGVPYQIEDPIQAEYFATELAK